MNTHPLDDRATRLFIGLAAFFCVANLLFIVFGLAFEVPIVVVVLTLSTRDEPSAA